MNVQVPPSLLFVLFISCRSAIRAAFNNKTRAAILATHCMEGVEAVCDRVAILASGRLRWLFAAEGVGVQGGARVWILNAVISETYNNTH